MVSERQQEIGRFAQAAAANRSRADVLAASTDPADQRAAVHLQASGALMGEDHAQAAALTDMIEGR